KFRRLSGLAADAELIPTKQTPPNKAPATRSTAPLCESETVWVYTFSVVSRSECPSRAWAVLRDSPFACRSVAWVCRNECHEIRGCLIRSHAGASSRLYRFLSLSGVPLAV